VAPKVAPPIAESGESREKAAKATNVGRTYVSAAKKLKDEQPELFKEVRAGKKTIQEAKAAVKAKKKAAVVETIKREIPAPKGPFRVIVVDPPWKYGARANDITHRARNPYPDMTVAEIKDLRIGKQLLAELAHEDCILWLWTTNAFVWEAFEVLDAWGFNYKTNLTWVKDRMGTGDWLRGKTEHCLMAVRGKAVVTLTNQTTALSGAVREHSRKPAEFYALVESLCPGNKLDVFGRERRAGWEVWGAEADNFTN
jgi:N6-adenosine-specific RNA methylase IME4